MQRLYELQAEASIASLEDQELLLRLLKSGKKELVQLAVSALCELGSELANSTLEEVVRCLSWPRMTVGCCAEVLLAAGVKCSIVFPILRDRIEDNYGAFPERNITLIGTLGDHARSEIPFLKGLLRSERWAYAANAILAVFELGDQSNVFKSSVRIGLGHRSSQVKLACVKAASVLEDKVVFSELAAIVEDESCTWAMRMEAARVLGTYGNRAEATVEALVAILREYLTAPADRDPQKLLTAFKRITARGHLAAPVLMEIVRSPNGDISVAARQNAILALEAFGATALGEAEKLVEAIGERVRNDRIPYKYFDDVALKAITTIDSRGQTAIKMRRVYQEAKTSDWWELLAGTTIELEKRAAEHARATSEL